ncbi:hypothetical protein ABEB36_015341 [Hypothenemus hampei]|uniref:Uncharacterized protein n=1 Tax=Hypothenemus hampei TaxID=57062 RepID=A0ABD1E0V8_HYPHA
MFGIRRQDGFANRCTTVGKDPAHPRTSGTANPERLAIHAGAAVHCRATAGTPGADRAGNTLPGIRISVSRVVPVHSTRCVPCGRRAELEQYRKVDRNTVRQ